MKFDDIDFDAEAITATTACRTLLRFVALVVYCDHAAAMRLWVSSQFDGQVLDADGRPIQGAVVLAVCGLGSGNIPVKLIKTVSRADGSFTIPKWGPSFSRSVYPMSYTQPILYAARAGYVPEQLYAGGFDPSDTYRFVDAIPLGSRFFTITLEALGGDPSERQELSFRAVSGPLRAYGRRETGCFWPQLPMFAAEMTKIERAYSKLEYAYRLDLKC